MDCGLQMWLHVHEQMSSRIPVLAQTECYEIVKPWSAQCLATGIKETELGRTTRGHSNFLNLFVPAGNAPKDYLRWQDCATEWFARMKDPTYKGGVYMPRDIAIERQVTIYQGGPACWSSAGETCANGETWVPLRDGSIELSIQQFCARVNTFMGVSQPVPMSPVSGGGLSVDPATGGGSSNRFGLVPKPSYTERWIPDNANIAWDNLGPRRVIGVTLHRQVGINWGTDGWFRMMWQPNGKPGGGQLGLTDFGVDHHTGETLVWNDWRGLAHPDCSANRAGWASGPWQHGSTAGEAFVGAFGVNAINRDRASIEVAGQYDSPISVAAFDQVVAITAWLADQGQVTWQQLPFLRTGVRYILQHHDFQNNKPCAGDVLINLIPEIEADVKQMLKHYQGGT